MYRKLNLSLAVSVTFGLALVLVVVANAQQPAPAEAKTTEQAFANIKVLTGIPAEQLLPTMNVWATSLGVGCPFCHTPPNFAADEKAPKSTARQMFAMMQGLNKSSFNGQNVMTCYSCHHGASIPGSGPAMAAPANAGPTPAMLPTPDEIVANYIAAVGGEQAIRKMTTRHITELHEIQGQQLPVEMERYEKAPDLAVSTTQAGIGTIAHGFDGKTAWVEMGTGNVSETAGAASVRAKRDSDFYDSFDLKKTYPALEVHGIEKSNGHNLYRLDGFASDGSPIQLYFDAQTGLLARKVTSAWLTLGEGAITTDYDDYRDVDGVKFPFDIRETGPKPNQRTEIHVQDLKINVPIDSSKFTMPAATTTNSWTMPNNSR